VTDTGDPAGLAGRSADRPALPAFRTNPDALVLQRVSESTVAVIDPRLVSNAAAVVMDDFIVAVDAGMRPAAARLFRTALEESFGRPVKYLCVTHHHADHTFGLAAFKDVAIVASAEIAGALEQSPARSPEALAAWKQNDPDGGAWLDEVEPVMPSLLFHGGLDIVGGDKVVEFRHSGGHTSCSVYGYVPDERVLLAGDLVFAGMFPFAGDETADPEVWMSILRAWQGLEIDHVIPGHGPVTGAEEIAGYLEFFEALKRNTFAAIAAGLGPAGIVVPPGYPAAARPEVVGRTEARWRR
jgi:cyclase